MSTPNVTDWPEPGERGQPLTRLQAAELLGRTEGALIQAERRTAEDRAPVPFPPCAGHAIPPGARRQPVPYWWFDDIVEYGQAAGMLGPAPGLALVGKVRGRNQYPITRAGVSSHG